MDVPKPVRTAADEEEDQDPSKNQFIAMVTKVLPISTLAD